MSDYRITNNKQEVLDLLAQGYEPVECSIGGESIVGPLVMDHHGERSHLEGVALRAYRDLFGARRNDPRFIVVGVADADAAFACAALAGILPHPSRAEELANAPPPVRESGTRDLIELAELVNRVDTDPIGTNLADEEWGDVLLTFNAVNASNRDDLGLAGAVALWRNLTSGHPALRPLIHAAVDTETERREAARLDFAHRISEPTDPVLALGATTAWGFDVWYQRRPDNGRPNERRGWLAPVVLALSAQAESITIGCPNKAVAEELFGEGGLRNVFPRLDEIHPRPGWGGREAIGGSPRGERMTLDDLRAAHRVVTGAVLAGTL